MNFGYSINEPFGNGGAAASAGSASKNPSPPTISLTPSDVVRPRNRAGTLPLSFMSPIETLPQHKAGEILGSFDQISLGLNSPSSIETAVNGSAGSSASSGITTRRMRSGSFFSTNSIWNDDSLASQQSVTDGTSYLLPLLTAQPGSSPGSVPPVQQRNRSYTTTAAIPNPTGFTQQNTYDLSTVIDNSLLDNLMVNVSTSSGPRLRSQTFSGSVPSVLPAPSEVAPRKVAPTQPILADDYDFLQLVITTNFDHPNMGPTRLILFDNLPQSIDALKLYYILNNSLGSSSYGQLPPQGPSSSALNIKSIRMTPASASKLALVECVSVEVAMNLKANFNHVELVPGVVLYAAFAKLVEGIPQKGLNPAPQMISGQMVQGQIPQMNQMVNPINLINQGHNQNQNQGVSKNQNHNLSQSQLNQSQPNHANQTNQVNQMKAVPVGFPTGGEGGEISVPVPTMQATPSRTSQSASPSGLDSVKDRLSQTVFRLLTRPNNISTNKIFSIISEASRFDKSNYKTNFGPLPDPIPLRQYDSPRLRELRKVLENTEAINKGDGAQELEDDARTMTQYELEELCLDMLDELPELCYDYLGNTIVQKLFMLVKSLFIKYIMIKEIAPYLTQLSIHKNGTWAVQKIISLSQSDAQHQLVIGQALKPYAVKLFNDQFGNYALQGCIKFCSPFNDFIFEAILDNFVEISFGRFGSRCIRTILESSSEMRAVSSEQVVLVAALIVEYANELVVNNNGSLLITWFLDTFNDLGSTADDRVALLTEKFLPNLAKLCTHKLANLTILKILNNRLDTRLKQLIMDAIFGPFHDLDESVMPSKMLGAILSETAHETSAGPLFIYKILSNPLVVTLHGEHGAPVDPARNARYYQFIVSQIRRILLEMNISNFQQYKKLMDEAGLSSNRMGRSMSMGGGAPNGNGHSPNGHRRGKRNMNTGNRHGKQQGQHQLQSAKYNGQAPYYQGYYPESFQGQFQGQQFQGQQFQGQPNFYAGGMSGQYMNAQQTQQDSAVMQQLEQLSLSSAALGYNSNPGTPTLASNQRNGFF